MSDNPTGRTFTEGEHSALVDAAVTRETAAAQEKITSLQAENAELQTKVDALTTEKAAETQRADQAVQELTDFKASAEAEKAAAARRESRKAEVAAANPLLPLDVEGDEDSKKRLDRIAAMSDEEYASYLTDMREVAKAAAPAGGTPPASQTAGTGAEPPRATAAFAGTPPAEESKPSVKGVIGLGRSLGRKTSA